MANPLDEHYRLVVEAIVEGELVPFLGAGVNRCGRPADTKWKTGQYLPDGFELAEYLAGDSSYPHQRRDDLLRVSQYIDLVSGSRDLYKKLRKVFNVSYPPTLLHRYFASLPAILRERGITGHQLLVTTNYDDLLERAFAEAGQSYDVVTYLADGEHRGRFLHLKPEGDMQIIEEPQKYEGLSLRERPVILKIHGAVDRETPEEDERKRRDSFVITEDHYVDYLARTNTTNFLPAQLASRMRTSHFLFLGYSLRDWNLRVLLRRIWGEQPLSITSWAIQLNPHEIDKKFWVKHNVEILDVLLDQYIAALSGRVQALPQASNSS